jgi:hypothetical protein
MQLLSSQLTKATGATNKQITANEKFLSQLSMQVGIADDDLRPAMAGFARVTGSVTKAQDLLKLALDGSAAKGKPLKTVSDALSKAYAGNTTQLVRMFPELKKSKDIMADYAKIVQGEAVSQADPFSRLNVAMGELQEKLGGIILPYVTDFIDQMMKPGGAIDQVGKFLEDIANPKTDAGKTFEEIKDAVGQTIQGVKDFFALFGNGDAMKGFGNVVSALVKALPALLALKGIMVLANSAKAIQNLVTAMMLIQGKGGTDVVAGGAGKGKGLFGKLTALPVVGTVATVLTMSGDSTVKAPRDLSNFDPKTGGAKGGYPVPFYQMKPSTTTNNVTINVKSDNPKVIVDTLSKYAKQNGGLPFSLSNVGKKP